MAKLRLLLMYMVAEAVMAVAIIIGINFMADGVKNSVPTPAVVTTR